MKLQINQPAFDLVAGTVFSIALGLLLYWGTDNGLVAVVSTAIITAAMVKPK